MLNNFFLYEMKMCVEQNVALILVSKYQHSRERINNVDVLKGTT